MQSGEWGAVRTRQQDRRANTVLSRAGRIIYTTIFLSTSTKDAEAGAVILVQIMLQFGFMFMFTFMFECGSSSCVRSKAFLNSDVHSASESENNNDGNKSKMA